MVWIEDRIQNTSYKSLSLWTASLVWTSKWPRAWQFNKQNVSVSNVLVWWQLLVFMTTGLLLWTNQSRALSETDQSEAWYLPSLSSGIKTSIWYRVWSWYRPICICWSLMASTHWSSSSNILVSSFTLYICSGFIFESHMTMIKSCLVFLPSALKSNQLVEKSRMSVNFCSVCFQFNYKRLMDMHYQQSLLMLIISLKFLLNLMTKCLCREQSRRLARQVQCDAFLFSFQEDTRIMNLMKLSLMLLMRRR